MAKDAADDTTAAAAVKDAMMTDVRTLQYAAYAPIIRRSAAVLKDSVAAASTLLRILLHLRLMQGPQ